MEKASPPACGEFVNEPEVWLADWLGVRLNADDASSEEPSSKFVILNDVDAGPHAKF